MVDYTDVLSEAFAAQRVLLLLGLLAYSVLIENLQLMTVANASADIRTSPRMWSAWCWAI